MKLVIGIIVILALVGLAYFKRPLKVKVDNFISKIKIFKKK